MFDTDFERNNGKKTRGTSTAKQPKIIAKTTLGRAKNDILVANVVITTLRVVRDNRRIRMKPTRMS